MADSKEKKEATYIMYKNGRAKIVTREVWERSWLSWWKRKHAPLN